MEFLIIWDDHFIFLVHFYLNIVLGTYSDFKILLIYNSVIGIIIFI